MPFDEIVSTQEFLWGSESGTRFQEVGQLDFATLVRLNASVNATAAAAAAAAGGGGEDDGGGGGAAALMDWRVELAYVNNFAYTYPASAAGGVCSDGGASGSIGNGGGATAVARAWYASAAPLPGGGLASGLLRLTAARNWPVPPFQVLMSLEDLSEVATVSAVLDGPAAAAAAATAAATSAAQSTLAAAAATNTSVGSGINGSAAGSAGGSEVAAAAAAAAAAWYSSLPSPAQVLILANRSGGQTIGSRTASGVDFLGSLTARPSRPGSVYPSNWHCNPAWYNDTTWCDCECGVPDPDCAPGAGAGGESLRLLPVSRCPPLSSSSSSSRGVQSWCSPLGRCAGGDVLAQAVAAAAGGEQGRAGWAASALVGILDSAEAAGGSGGGVEGCAACPGDAVRGGRAALSSDAEWRCFDPTEAAVQAHLDDDEDEDDDEPSPADADNSADPGGGLFHTFGKEQVQMRTNLGTSGDVCLSRSRLWPALCLLRNRSLFQAETNFYVHFPLLGMNFPVISRSAASDSSSANSTSTPPPVALIGVYLGSSRVFLGRLVKSLPNQGKLQLLVVDPADSDGAPLPQLAALGARRLRLVRATLLSTVWPGIASILVSCPAPALAASDAAASAAREITNESSTEAGDIAVLVAAASAMAGASASPACFRPGLDRGFQVHLDRLLLPIAEVAQPSAVIGGLVTSDGTTVSTSRLASPDSSNTATEGEVVLLRLAGPPQPNAGARRGCRRAVQGFSRLGASGSNLDRLVLELTGNLFGESAPCSGNLGQAVRNGYARNLTGDSVAAVGDAAAVNVTAGAHNGTDQHIPETNVTVADDPTRRNEAGEAWFVFSAGRRPPVVLRSADGLRAELRLANETFFHSGRWYLVLDRLPSSGSAPASAETAFDGLRRSACRPAHLPCLDGAYTARLLRPAGAGGGAATTLPSAPATGRTPDLRSVKGGAGLAEDPGQSPPLLTVDLALFAVPEPAVTADSSPSSPTSSAFVTTDDGSNSTDANASWADVNGTMETNGAAQATASTSTTSISTTAATPGYLCPSLIAKDNSGSTIRSSLKYSAFGWNGWTLRTGRVPEVTKCSDESLSATSCSDLPDIPRGAFWSVCNNAMPPTHAVTFAHRVPVNNKWQAPRSELEANGEGLLNMPEYDMDFTIKYHLTYDDSAITTANRMQADMGGRGDRVSDDGGKRLWLDGGAGEFLGRGAGFGTYTNLASRLPANPPVLRPRLRLGADLARSAADLVLGRAAAFGETTDTSASPMAEANSAAGSDAVEAAAAAAAAGWPRDAPSATALLERFEPLELTWDLSTIGGRSDDQVLLLLPGTRYLLEATLQLQPVYMQDVMGGVHLLRWRRQVISSTASRYPINDPNLTHVVELRYHINLDPHVSPITLAREYSARRFVSDVAAAIGGYLLLGALVLRGIRRLRRALGSKRTDASGRDGEGEKED